MRNRAARRPVRGVQPRWRDAGLVRVGASGQEVAMTEEAAFAVADEVPATTGRTVLSTSATAVKTLEYAVLGMLVGRLLRTPSSTFGSHALTGLAVGLVF